MSAEMVDHTFETSNIHGCRLAAWGRRVLPMLRIGTIEV
ncbi:hypothetical protein BH24ACT15_BH24ACT15_06990 [soil metagenome]